MVSRTMGVGRKGQGRTITTLPPEAIDLLTYPSIYPPTHAGNAGRPSTSSWAPWWSRATSTLPHTSRRARFVGVRVWVGIVFLYVFTRRDEPGMWVCGCVGMGGDKILVCMCVYVGRRWAVGCPSGRPCRHNATNNDRRRRWRSSLTRRSRPAARGSWCGVDTCLLMCCVRVCA